ncbi:endo-1,6-alpha-mannosidase [Rhodocollybia butyracea]|uniref:Endo-1,6-alpha-mannosidase n=1 Tax=Rhodocollybia butyracea TaxID=206335 RepID=A0A9P5PJQ1_9AGAR|nr:endo-1,6-alpha-mannosidase [Rhodocollybia butyracea]
MWKASIMALIPLFLLLLPSLAFSQDLGVPLSWRDFSNSRLRAERISIAKDAINSILPQLDTSNAQFHGIGYWQAGNVFSAMANFDHLAGTKTYQTQVTNGLKTAFKLYPISISLGTTTMMPCGGQLQLTTVTGRTRTKAYCQWPLQLGNMSRSSGYNVSVHHLSSPIYQSVISTADASSGKQPKKSFAIAKTCDGESMAGGVFWRPVSTDSSINSITTGLYTTLSAFLAETTKDAKYTNAAILSAQWIQKLQINAKGIVLDGVDGSKCTRSPASWLFTYNSGKYIEGLSVLKDVTGDIIWKALMTNITAAAVKSSAWEGSNGIITEGASPKSNNDGVGFKAIFIRGLDEVSARSGDNSALQILIHSYNDVQYNALLQLAANGTSYSSDWKGPPQAFTTWGQLAALDVMVTAINTNSP